MGEVLVRTHFDAGAGDGVSNGSVIVVVTTNVVLARTGLEAFPRGEVAEVILGALQHALLGRVVSKVIVLRAIRHALLHGAVCVVPGGRARTHAKAR